MKAMLVDENKNLIWSEVKKPTPKEDEILIKIYAVALNRADLLQRNRKSRCRYHHQFGKGKRSGNTEKRGSKRTSCMAMDCLCGETLGECLPYMAEGGYWVIISTLAGVETNIKLRPILTKGLHIVGSMLRKRSSEEKSKLTALQLYVCGSVDNRQFKNSNIEATCTASICVFFLFICKRRNVFPSKKWPVLP